MDKVDWNAFYLPSQNQDLQIYGSYHWT
jgi:hypothetical protein